MNSDLLSLVRDTLSVLKEDRRVPECAITFPEPKKPVVTPYKPAPKVEAKTPPATIFQKREPAKLESSAIFEKIQKHLPHVRLIQNIPAMKQVALVVFQREDLPFLKTLREAIQKRYCQVKMIDGGKIDPSTDWEQFELVISQKEVSAKRLIILASIATYQNNTEQKKLLWSAICHYLLPKSS